MTAAVCVECHPRKRDGFCGSFQMSSEAEREVVDDVAPQLEHGSQNSTPAGSAGVELRGCCPEAVDRVLAEDECEPDHEEEDAL